jgi:hypothetical protein
MGLLDRIQAARQASEGEVPSGTVVELNAATKSSRPRQQWGRPGRCPECDGAGYLDHIDLVDRVMYEHCRDCGHKWKVTRAEIEAGA